MTKKFLALMLSLILVLSFAACGKKEEKATTEADTKEMTVEQEIVKMVGTDLPAIKEDRETAVKMYNSYFDEGSDGNSDEWLKTLQEKALVSYDAYMTNLTGLSYTNKEVNDLLAIYVQSAQAQRDAIQAVIDALKAGNPDGLDNANAYLHNSKVYLKQYEDQLLSLCTKYNITINGEFQMATFTDATLLDASPSDAK